MHAPKSGYPHGCRHVGHSACSLSHGRMHAAWNVCAHGSAVVRPCASPRPPTSGSRQMAHVSAASVANRDVGGGVETPRRAPPADAAPRPRFDAGGALVPRRAEAGGAGS